MFKRKVKNSLKVSQPALVKKNDILYLKDIESGYMLKYDLFLKYANNNK